MQCKRIRLEDREITAGRERASERVGPPLHDLQAAHRLPLDARWQPETALLGCLMIVEDCQTLSKFDDPQISCLR